MMNLKHFESYIDRIIYLRGYDYYENGFVTSIEETEPNVYVAEVEGTETYTVSVELDETQNIIETWCDCPYDMGEYCKHQVAVFLTLQEMKNSESAKNHFTEDKTIVNNAGVNITKTRQNNKPDLKQILSARSKEELVDFLLEIGTESEEMQQRILLNFDDGDDEEEIRKAVSLIQTYINNHSDRYGFVNYRDTDHAVYGAELVLEKANSAFAQNKIVHAVNLALCVVREMVDLIQYADDSDGIISGTSENGFTLIEEIIENTELKSSEKNTVFENLMKEASHRRYDDWSDWRITLLKIASKISDTPDLRNKLEEYMQLFTKNKDMDTWSGSYFAEEVNQIRYNMILFNDGEKKAQEFIEQNLHFSSFRKMAIEQAMQRKDYDQVIKLAVEGETKDKGYPGLINDWRKYRYKAYQLSGKLDEQRGVAMDFILDGNFAFYKELKNTYDINEWAAVYPKIISLLEDQKRMYSDIYTRILIEENEKEKLLEYVQKNTSSIECYYKHLIPEFKKEVYDLFLKHIEQTASRAGNRRDYQGVCAIIRNLKKAGGNDQALEIKQKLYAKYANRPAFRDELTKV